MLVSSDNMTTGVTRENDPVRYQVSVIKTVTTVAVAATSDSSPISYDNLVLDFYGVDDETA